MPGFHESADDQIKRAIRILRIKDKNKVTLIPLEKRVAEFKTALESADKEGVQKQYERFASTVISCVDRPQQADSKISWYINHAHYYPVNVTQKQLPDPSEFKIFAGLAILGVSLVLTSIPLFFFHPNCAGLILAGGILLITPSLLYFCAPARLNPEEKKAEEMAIFTDITTFMQAPEPSPSNSPLNRIAA